MMKRYRGRFGINHIFYIDEQYLIINKLKYESPFQILIPLKIKFRLDSIYYVEIGYAHWRYWGYMPYIQIVRETGRKSVRYWFQADMYDSKRKVMGPVKDLGLVKSAMEKTACELKETDIKYKINEEKTVKIFL